jgi:hypothetical protein
MLPGEVLKQKAKAKVKREFSMRDVEVCKEVIP